MARQQQTKPKAPRAAKKPKAKRSHLELRWLREWERQGGPAIVEEFKFHPVRKWRADFAHLESKTLIEIEGGAAGGRHTRIGGFKADLDKYLTAHLHGWRVIRIGAHQVRGDIIRAVIGSLRGDSAESKCPHCTQGYIQDTGFDRCNHCNAEDSAESSDEESWAGAGGAAGCGGCGERVGACVCDARASCRAVCGCDFGTGGPAGECLESKRADGGDILGGWIETRRPEWLN